MIPILLCTTALAADTTAPEFLLGDVGVRVDLPGSWKMTRWSDWDFAGQSGDGAVLVFAWATPIQVPVTEAPPWAPVFESKVAEMSGQNPKVGATSVTTIGERPVAFVDVGFQYRDGGKGTMYGATVEVTGKNFHLATISPDKVAGAGKKARQDLVHRLEFQGGPVVSTFGTKVAAKGVETTLPKDWRPSLDSEWSTIVPTLAKLGLEDVTDCWVAIRPRPVDPPDAMVTCNRPMTLGVVDEHSFATADAQVRKKLFGKIPEGVPVALPDRTGLLYAPKEGLAFGVVPDADGVAVTWALGAGDLGASVREVLAGSTWAGPHPVDTNQRVSYWLTERTFSPQILCPSSCCVGGAGLLVAGVVGAVLLRGRGKPADEDAFDA